MSTSQKYKLSIAYDGTHYTGWQIQSNGVSIQALIQEALGIILRTPIKITGAGRTDSGVHALEQIAHFTTSAPLDLRKTLLSLNGILPEEIRILTLEKVAPDFHARYSALGKIYRYHLILKGKKNPFKAPYATMLSYPIDLNLLQEGAKRFIGTHDFTSFSNEAHRGSASRSGVRTIKRLEITTFEEEVILEFEGNGFLYKMVRNIVGTLLDVARGKIPLHNLEEIFAAKDRRLAGTCAPPEGLFLVKVFYFRE